VVIGDMGFLLNYTDRLTQENQLFTQVDRFWCWLLTVNNSAFGRGISLPFKLNRGMEDSFK
jgi:hypothetical protein